MRSHPARPGRLLRLAPFLAAIPLAACGTARREDPARPAETFTVKIVSADFPASQRLAERTRLVLAVRNVGRSTIPDLAVTITNPLDGASTQAFATHVDGPGLASHSRPVWIVDQAPGPCAYSCRAGGPGGAVTSFANTWALGALAPGATASFDWVLTAVRAGSYRVRYRVAPGLDAGPTAVVEAAAPRSGTFAVAIRAAPKRTYIDSSGRIVSVP